MRRAALTRGGIPKEQLRIRFYAVSAGRSIAGRHPFRPNDSTSVFPLVVPREDGFFELHEVVRDAIYATIPFAERRKWHDRLAAAYAPLDDWSGLTEFLHHLVRAGRREEAVGWVLANQSRILDRARALFAPERGPEG